MQFVELTIDAAVALVELNRPPVNALSEKLGADLEEAVSRCRDPKIRAVVVTGQPHFSVGADIKEFKEALDQGRRERTAGALSKAIDILESLRKPTIAAVHGFALGGGCELSLACDFRYVAEDSRIGQPEILLGLIPGAGGTQRLQRLIGFQRAKDLVLSGRQMDATEALEAGYADQVVPSEDLLPRVLADAANWAAMPTAAIGAAKRAMAEGRGVPLDDALDIESAAFSELFGSEDALEGVTAFVEKRQAVFKGG